MRIILITGKGGVGKTTVAAATAIRTADLGHRTLVMSTDPAHSLADAYQVRLGDEPTTVVEGLDAQQIDSQQRLEESWGAVRDYLTEIFDWSGLNGIEAEELTVFPGMDELFSLASVRDHVDSGKYDVIIVDCAPTAETLRLLSLPEVMSWYMEKMFPVGRKVAKVVRPVMSRVSSMPIANEQVFDSVTRFYERIDGIREILGDPEITSARLVMNPEKMVIAEARRTYTYLGLFGYAVDSAIVNRVLPDVVTDPISSGGGRSSRRISIRSKRDSPTSTSGTCASLTRRWWVPISSDWLVKNSSAIPIQRSDCPRDGHSVSRTTVRTSC